MDWPVAIDKNRTALLSIITALMASLGLVSGGRLTSLPFFLFKRALRILRPAESALRRLIMIAAHEMMLRGVKLPALRVAVRNPLLVSRKNPCSVEYLPSFNLIEPLKNFEADAPDFDGIYAGNHCDADARTYVPAAELGVRLLIVKKVLENLPRQARRLLRWYEKRDQCYAQKKPHRYCPMRPGTAPGWRQRKVLEVDYILKECHLLVVYMGQRRDST